MTTRKMKRYILFLLAAALLVLVSYEAATQEAKVGSMVVTGPAPRFGWLRIGVGSPGWLVRLACLPDSRLSEDRLARYRAKYDPDLGYLCYSPTVVLFRFNERRRVECLVLC